jgi:hypothetical protein
LPIELCFIVPNQKYSGLLSRKQVAEVIATTARRPEALEISTKQQVKDLLDFSAKNLVASSFGLKCSGQSIAVPAHLLAYPPVSYTGAPEVQTSNRRDNGMNKFQEPAAVASAGLWDFAGIQLY